MLYEGQRTSQTKQLPSLQSKNGTFFLYAYISSGPDFISHRFEISYYSRKIISSPNGFQIHVLLKLDCPELDHRTVLEQRFDGQNVSSSIALRGQDLKPEVSTCHRSLPHQNLLGKAHNPRTGFGEQTVTHPARKPLVSQWTISVFCCPGPVSAHPTTDCGTLLALTEPLHCTRTATKVLKTWLFEATNKNVN